MVLMYGILGLVDMCQCHSIHSIQCGAVRCILWVKRPNETLDVLIYGTGLGYLVIWKLTVGKLLSFKEEIVC